MRKFPWWLLGVALCASSCEKEETCAACVQRCRPFVVAGCRPFSDRITGEHVTCECDVKVVAPEGLPPR